MHWRRLVVFLLLLPAFALGPGWELHVCPRMMLRLFESSSCCTMEAAQTSCCEDGESSTHDPVAGTVNSCAACCIDIETSDERSAPLVAAASEELQRAHAAALAVFVQPAELFALPPAAARLAVALNRPPPASPGRCTPLPLRI